MKTRYVVSCRRPAFLCDRLLAKGVLLDAIDKEGEKLCFSVSFRQSAAVEEVLSEYGFDYTKKGYLGARAFLRALLSRPFLLISFVLTLALVILSQSFVFGYTIKGNRFVNTASVEAVLRENGATGVVYKGKLDTTAIKKAVIAMEGVSFAGVKTEGNRLLVDIKEELPREEPDEERFEPIASLYSAVVTRIVAESGTPVVHSGDRVQAGDLLISPTYTFTEGEAPSPARGEVWGVVTYQKEVLLPLYTVETVRTGEVFKAKTLSLFGKEIGRSALPPFEQYDLTERVIYSGCGVTVTEKNYMKKASVTLCHDLDAEAPALLKRGLEELLLDVPFLSRERGRTLVTQKKLDNVLYIVIYYSVEQRIDPLFTAR